MGGDKDEKKELEDIMVDIVMFVKCYNVLFYLVLYLLIFEGKLYEEGQCVSIKYFKGFCVIGYWLYVMYGFECD